MIILCVIFSQVVVVSVVVSWLVVHFVQTDSFGSIKQGGFELELGHVVAAPCRWGRKTTALRQVTDTQAEVDSGRVMYFPWLTFLQYKPLRWQEKLGNVAKIIVVLLVRLSVGRRVRRNS